MLITSKGIPFGCNFCSNCPFMKRTCGPNNKTFTSLFSKFVSDSEVETDLRVSFSPIEVEEENYPENNTLFIAIIVPSFFLTKILI